MTDASSAPPLVICTQPRRIAAISVSERVAFERGESLGDVVGYHIRLDHKYSEHTRLLYVTTGILLQYLQDPAVLARISHIVLDEVHERQVTEKPSIWLPILRYMFGYQVEMDFLMTILKMKMNDYPNLRLVSLASFFCTLGGTCLITFPSF
jgi:hypothetical protein